MQEIEENQVQVSATGDTVWVHAMDGSTVGRFCKRFGLDVHTTVTEQMSGVGQCLHCTHEPAGQAEWKLFRELMRKHYQIHVDVNLISFS